MKPILSLLAFLFCAPAFAQVVAPPPASVAYDGFPLGIKWEATVLRKEIADMAIPPVLIIFAKNVSSKAISIKDAYLASVDGSKFKMKIDNDLKPEEMNPVPPGAEFIIHVLFDLSPNQFTPNGGWNGFDWNGAMVKKFGEGFNVVIQYDNNRTVTHTYPPEFVNSRLGISHSLIPRASKREK